MLWLSGFMLDGIFLWLVLTGFAVAALVSMEYNRPKWCTAIIIMALLILQFYTAWHPLAFVVQHPIDAITLVMSYFLIGSGWIVVKWWFHVHWIGDKFDTIKATCLMQVRTRGDSYFNTDGTLNDAGLQAMYRVAADYLDELRLPLQVSEHKGELYMWWLCWPLSVAWTLINDPVKRLWWFVYRELGTMLQNMSNRRFKI